MLDRPSPVEPRRAVIYARFSTELQNEKSAEDQIDLCRAYARREGFRVVDTYKDEAKSGASIHGRDGILGLLADAKAGKFDVLIVEALDRLSRDMEDLTGMYKRLGFLGVEIETVHEGKANTLSVGMRAIFAQLFREDNVHKIRRGMTGLIRQVYRRAAKPMAIGPIPQTGGGRSSCPNKPQSCTAFSRTTRRAFLQKPYVGN